MSFIVRISIEEQTMSGSGDLKIKEIRSNVLFFSVEMWKSLNFFDSAVSLAGFLRTIRLGSDPDSDKLSHDNKQDIQEKS